MRRASRRALLGPWLLVAALRPASAGTTPEGQRYLEKNAKREDVTVTASGLQYRVVRSGKEGARTPNATSPCDLHYRGTLIDGKEFDSSYNRGKTITFAPNQVIPGWTEALQLMREGDKWELTIPSELAYGDQGAGSAIPGGAVLVFVMEVLRVGDPSMYIIAGVDFSAPHIFMFIAMAVVFIISKLKVPKRGNSGPRGPLLPLAEARDAGNPRVFFEIQIGGEEVGRVEFELFKKVCPKTVENFRCLCTGEKSAQLKRNVCYRGSGFHRIIPGFMCQGGDFIKNNGSGGESIYGRYFEDEFELGYVAHTQPMMLSMANRGPNTNGSQFFITTAKTGHLDKKHVVFGILTSGEEVVRKMEEQGDQRGTVKAKVRISDCGECKKKSD